PVVQAHLDADRAAAAAVLREARAQRLRHRATRVARLPGVADVAVERALAGLRDDLARGPDLAVVFEAGTPSQLASEVRAEALHERLLGRRAARGECRQPELGQARGGLRADSRQQPRRRLREARARLLAAEHDEPGRLLRVGCDLRDELVRADADRAGQLRGV